MTSLTRTTRRLAGIAALLASAALVLTGCVNDPLAEQYREGSGKGYVAGDGSWTEIAVDDRAEPIEFEGIDQNGDAVSSDDYLGEVLVVNFWYAACAPCRAEAPDLVDLSAQYDGEGASFLGVNVRDQADTAISFDETFGIEYPSIIDANDGAVKLAFSGDVPPNAVPTTIVLDAEGRVAARIVGQLRDASILDTLIRDTIAETAE
ncbi:thiol-disulfide isomerase/thioredoxin [Labedella gwakjiensis]|uniref:Thiol-disulfide isomerase/thioredoxin n=1 Tax=Labedella gwakjiensis TaxID=390269 RepID=A0A2P8GSY1_9MICO|nr:TlpA disulfide reductase family protein [Labedella gwakjiensis]PSL37067.1 thiol-disulfide isomerase/thioredoxin [Labedella gwakjiensis]RUQ82028.1 TlpA family protein disulfide reductase [Labedella gwakjiensis]